MSKLIRAVIFDLDGLLADTERLHCRAYQMAFLERGVALDEIDYCEHWVRFGKGIVDWVTMQKLDLDPHALRSRKSEHYQDLLVSSLRPMDGALELLDRLHRKTKIALASSSYRDAIDGVLAGLQIAHFFEVIVSGLDEAEGGACAPDGSLYFVETGLSTPRKTITRYAQDGRVLANNFPPQCGFKVLRVRAAPCGIKCSIKAGPHKFPASFCRGLLPLSEV